jgi:two-component system phosphate regulon sensor histidine kinase PhoR
VQFHPTHRRFRTDLYRGWFVELARSAAFLLLCGILGVMTGHLLVALLAGTVILLGWHLAQLLPLVRLLSDGSLTDWPLQSGLWRTALARIAALRTGNQKRKRKLSRFIKRFREAVTALPDAIVILGKDGIIEWFNPAAQDLLGLGRPRSLGQPLETQLDHPLLAEYLDAGDYTRALEFSSPVNKAKILSLRITPFGKKKRQHLLIAREITRVYHLDKARRDFVANVSHELRTPLTVISGFLETLADAERDSPDLARSRGLMLQQSLRMQNIIDDLLTLSRLEMDDRADTSQPVPVPSMLGSVVDDARALGVNSGHVIELEADGAVWLKGNAMELRSAFSNLVFNAVRHTPPRTRVDVKWGTAEKGPFLTVSDTGEGIAARHISRLTERFYRVDKGRSRNTGGTGLGLAIVRHVLTRHRGDLKVTSEAGKGSAFTCLFPADLMVPSRPSESGSPPSERDADADVRQSAET